MNGHDWMNGLSEEELLEAWNKKEAVEAALDRIYARMDNPEWRPIKGHPGYEVSDSGYIRSLKSGEPRIMATWPNQQGHRYVKIDKDRVSIHRTVAEAFIPNPDNYNVVRHLNDIPYDNDVENLAWGTYKDNTEDCRRNGHMFMKSVYCYETDRIYKSCVEAARDLGVHKSAVTLCCQGKAHEAGGYHLCYLSDKPEKMKNLKRWLNHSTYKPVKATNLSTGEEIIFESRGAAARHLGIPDCGISSTITGRTQHSHGWKFEDWSDYYE